MEADASPQQEHKGDTLLALAKGPLAASAARLAAHSRAVPSGRDFHFYHNFDQFRAPAREIAARSESLLSSIGSSALLLGAGGQREGEDQPATLPQDLDDAHDWLVNLNDEILERFGASMDEFRSLREEEEGGAAGRDRVSGMEAGGFHMVYGKKGKKKKGAASADVYGGEVAVADAGGGSAVKVVSRDKKTTAARSQVPFHIPSIPRPQDEFKILVNNSNQPFEHVWLEKSEDGSRFVHPLVVYGDVYMLDDDMKWKELPPMPKPNSHIEFAWILFNNSIIVVGGTTEKHPMTKRMMLVGEVFRFNLDTSEWSVIGRMPYRIKTTLAGYWDGWLYFTSGQRDRGPDDPQPRKVVGDTWRTKLH